MGFFHQRRGINVCANFPPVIGLLYSLFTHVVGASVLRLSKWGTVKQRRWAEGVHRSHQLLRECPRHAHIWIHCASLGEYEQAAPLIDAIQRRFPQKKILLTFFSPSGHEKLHRHPDIEVHYLPLDTPDRTRRWVEFFRPDMALFIKYEFWPNVLQALAKAKVPTYLIAGVFRPNQPYFRWAQRFYRLPFRCFSGWFVQDDISARVLQRHGWGPVMIVGDPRIDRVVQWQPRPEILRRLRKFFPDGSAILVAGSTYPPEEQMLANVRNAFPQLRLIIAPHEVTASRIDFIQQLLPDARKWSDPPQPTSTLIIDTIGILKDAYHIGNITLVGGGFGNRIHNILEPAAAGCPVLFGPRHHDFPEAEGLIQCGGAFVFDSPKQLLHHLDHLLNNAAYGQAGHAARAWIEQHKGATQRIMNAIFGPSQPQSNALSRPSH